MNRMLVNTSLVFVIFGSIGASVTGSYMIGFYFLGYGALFALCSIAFSLIELIDKK